MNWIRNEHSAHRPVNTSVLRTDLWMILTLLLHCSRFLQVVACIVFNWMLQQGVIHSRFLLVNLEKHLGFIGVSQLLAHFHCWLNFTTSLKMEKPESSAHILWSRRPTINVSITFRKTGMSSIFRVQSYEFGVWFHCFVKLDRTRSHKNLHFGSVA